MKKMKKKRGLRFLGIDDGYFVKNQEKKVPLVGVVFRGDNTIEGILMDHITRDGFDVTETVIKMVVTSKFHRELNAIITSGNTYGGFNPLDIVKLSQKTGLGTLNVTRRLPRERKIVKALMNLPQGVERYDILKKAGIYYRYQSIYYQKSNLSIEECEHVLSLTQVNGNIPEPNRLAHLIGAAIEKGESGGGA